MVIDVIEALRKEIEHAKSDIIGGIVIDYAVYKELRGKIRGLQSALDICQQDLKSENKDDIDED